MYNKTLRPSHLLMHTLLHTLKFINLWMNKTANIQEKLNMLMIAFLHNFLKLLIIYLREQLENRLYRMLVAEDFTATLRLNVTDYIWLIGFRLIDHIVPYAINVFAY